jgi:hypothetical protein
VSALERDSAMWVRLCSVMKSYLAPFPWKIWIWLYRQVAVRSRQTLRVQIFHMQG